MVLRVDDAHTSFEEATTQYSPRETCGSSTPTADRRRTQSGDCTEKDRASLSRYLE